jgi:transposase
MSMQLTEISQAVSPGAHAALLLDQAGWHTSGKLTVPANISLVPLPPKSPELNPTENVWQYLRATTGSPTACSPPKPTSSTTAATPGTG